MKDTQQPGNRLIKVIIDILGVVKWVFAVGFLYLLFIASTNTMFTIWLACNAYLFMHVIGDIIENLDSMLTSASGAKKSLIKSCFKAAALVVMNAVAIYFLLKYE